MDYRSLYNTVKQRLATKLANSIEQTKTVTQLAGPASQSAGFVKGTIETCEEILTLMGELEGSQTVPA
jgi:hypothetical protein